MNKLVVIVCEAALRPKKKRPYQAEKAFGMVVLFCVNARLFGQNHSVQAGYKNRSKAPETFEISTKTALTSWSAVANEKYSNDF